ncbi:hypothetical protein RCXUPER_164 [Rhodobacter phage RcXuper]|nr:hypothetical protein RCXUPER_164 [Rhodobacter phage RcXuper]
MARYTRDEMLQKLRDLTDKPLVYKTEVDDAKYHLANVFDAEKRKIGEAFTHAGQWQNLSEAERKVDLPYELRHLFGKKFIKSIDDAKETLGRSTPYLDAVGHMVSELSPLHTLMQNLIARQVKGRRPVESTKKIVGTRTQLRAICPICFRQHAVDGQNMVSHGFTLQYGFQNGICSGYRRPHFGTEAGRAVTEKAAADNAAHAEALRRNAAKILSGESTIALRDRKGNIIENPTQRDRIIASSQLEGQAGQTEAYVRFLQTQLANWQPHDPVKVQVDILE